MTPPDERRTGSRGAGHKAHWYLIVDMECPVCGAGETRRERRYGPRPLDPGKCYEHIVSYDYCNER